MDINKMYELFEMTDGDLPLAIEVPFVGYEFPEPASIMTEGAVLSYLKREEVIMSLAKEKSKREKTVLKTEAPFFELFRDTKLHWEDGSDRFDFRYITETIAEKIVRPALEEIADELEEKQSEAYANCTEQLQRLVPCDNLTFDFNLSRLETTVLREKVKKGRGIGVHIANRHGYELCYTLTGKVSSANKNNYFFWKKEKTSERVYIGDYSDLAPAVLYHQMDLLFEARCKDLPQKERMEDLVYRSIWEEMKKAVDGCCAQEGHVVMSRAAAEDEFLNFLVENGYQYRILEEDATREDRQKVFLRSDLAVYAPFQPSLPRIWYTYAEKERDKNGELVNYGRRLERIYTKMFELFYKIWKQGQENMRFLAEQKEVAARVFQTKKSIPPKHMQAMETSIFNHTYGYVEIDEECDLKLFHEIEKEFLALKKYCFHTCEEHKGIALRFRKLGRHHANGLYFPLLRCQCVDIRNVSSFGHEYLHMEDYEGGKRSEKYDFLEVKERYQVNLRRYVKNLPADAPQKKVLSGRSNSNLEYYLNPTEIYARCGEMYFTCCHGINNSLLKPKFGFQYPKEDPVLMDMIEDYYSKYFPLPQTEALIQTAAKEST